MDKEVFKQRVYPKYIDENDYDILMSLEDHVNTKGVNLNIKGKEELLNPNFRIVALSQPLIMVKGSGSKCSYIVKGDCTIDFQEQGATIFRFSCVAEVDRKSGCPEVTSIKENVVCLTDGKYSCIFHLKDEEQADISFCFNCNARITQENGEVYVYGEIKQQIEDRDILLPVDVYNITVRDTDTDEVVWRKAYLDIAENINV